MLAEGRDRERWAGAWLLLGLAFKSPWSALGALFLLSFAQMGLENSFRPCRASHFDSEALFLLCKGDHWSRAMTIESSLESGLSHESAQDGCSGTCVKLEASNPPEVKVWYIKGIHRLKGTSIENNSAVN